MNFCCRCGKENNKVEKVITEDYNPALGLEKGKSLYNYNFQGFEIRDFGAYVYITISYDEVGNYEIGECYYAVVKNDYTLSQLSEERERLKEYLVSNNFCSGSDFEENFGVYTVLMAC